MSRCGSHGKSSNGSTCWCSWLATRLPASAGSRTGSTRDTTITTQRLAGRQASPCLPSLTAARGVLFKEDAMLNRQIATWSAIALLACAPVLIEAQEGTERFTFSVANAPESLLHPKDGRFQLTL